MENDIKICSCESSCMKGHGYKNGTLRIDFGNNVYDYQDVPEEVYEEFLRSASKGKFLATKLKNRFKAVKV